MSLQNKSYRPQISLIIADDHQAFRERIKTLLNTFNQLHIAGEASNGEEAIHLILTKKPDIVILDISMPGKTGIQVLQTLAEDLGNTIIIVLTNLSDFPYKQKCLELGAHYFLDKSKQFDQLNDTLAAAVSNL